MKKRPLVTAFLLAALCIFLGRDVFFKTEPLPGELLGETVTLAGTVCRREKKAEKLLIYLKDISLRSEKIHQNGIVYTQENVRCRIGSRIEVTGTLEIPQTASNPGQFDQASYYGARGIGLFLYDGHVREQSGSYSRPGEAACALREALLLRLQTALSALSREDAGVLSAMLLGDRGDLDEETAALYKSGGISHVLAISGLHISMAGMALYCACRFVFGGFGLPAAVSGLVMIFYGWFTGGSVSTTRAVVMFLLYLLAQVLGREYDRWSALAFAGFFILVRQPLQLFQCGFQLTMLSVAGVETALMCQRRSYRRKKKSRLPKRVKSLCETLRVSLTIQAFTLPCMLYWFCEYAPWGILMNLVVLPLMPVVLGFGALGMAAACVLGGAAAFLAGPAHAVLALYLALCRAVGNLPLGTVICGAPKGWQMLLYGAGLLLLLAGRGKRIRRVLLLAGLCLFFYPAASNGGSLAEDVRARLTGREYLKLTFLDVGQGDAIFLRAPDGTVWLIDGGSSTESRVGKYRLIPFLKNQGIGRVDYVIATHPDADHINGLSELFSDSEGIRIKCLAVHPTALKEESGQALAALAEGAGARVVRIGRGDGFLNGSLTLACLWPEKDGASTEKNQNSLVFRLDYGSFSALLTGDLEGGVEEELVSSGTLSRVRLLKAGHHGSKNATSEALLSAVSPAVAVLSYGEGNRYGHPARETLERLEAAGVNCLRTAASGALTVRADGKRWWIEGVKDAIIK